mgnify:CR=1 FL=1
MLNEKVNNLNEELGHVLSDLTALTSELSTVVQSGTQDVKDNLIARIAALQGRADQLQKRIVQSMRHGAHYVDECVRERPYQAVAVLGVVGFCLGVALGSTRSGNGAHKYGA